MIRKAVLIGGKESPWVSGRGMKKPKMVVTGKDNVRVAITMVMDPSHCAKWNIVGPGKHELSTGNWACAMVVEGDHRSVLCTLISEA